MRRFMKTLAAALLCAVAGAGVSATARAQAIDVPAALADRVLGNPDAPVTIIDYSSLTCPHCAEFHNTTLPQIKKEYLDTGKAKLIFRDFPFDQWALKASALARCAPKERYYPLLDVLFKQQNVWSRAADPAKALKQIGALAGVPEAAVDACWASKELTDGILQIQIDGSVKDKVEATPTFVINGKEKISGAQPFAAFAKAIDAAK
ncbi:protein-disulfide isomerase [Azospirillum fermentarium]|uniref:DsbA family protein n=1 Tax=Azospirillum fermentarium TaxID=1233114 RepID=UPI002227BAB9|nr:DsbA family protein [Azospirillum fermentarium]MCW2246093.1 protein-disulfide isomerase [Azospirillum fermentarium]